MIREIQGGFYTKLKDWETTASTASATFNVLAPQTASLPYVTFGLLTESPIGDFDDFEAIENLTYYVNCFTSKSIADACSMADHVMTALDNVTLTVSGYTTMKCVREFMGSVIYEPDIGVFQLPLRYRILLDKT